MLIDIMNDHCLERLVHFPTREKIYREAKATQQLHKSLQHFNDLNNFVQIKRILHNYLLFISSENLNMIG